MKWKLKTLVVIAALVVFTAGTAMADNFILTGSGSGLTINALIGGNCTGNTCLATSMTGNITVGSDTFQITGLLPGGGDPNNPVLTPDGQWLYDNLFNKDGVTPFLDFWGLGFTMTVDNYGNIFWNPPGDVGLSVAQGGLDSGQYFLETATLTETPEPESLALLGSGLLGLGGAIRKKMVH